MTSSSGIYVEKVSKKFCQNFRRTLAYGVRDILGELAWWQTGKTTKLRPSEFWAVRDVSFTLQPGEALGIIGENGAGKSTLLKMLHGLLKPDAGGILVNGQICAMDLGTGMMPLLTGRENIYAQSALLGYSQQAIQKQLDSIIAFAELESFIDTTVGYYSTGMRARLAFAIAAHLEPDILLVDEVLAVGDLGFQRKCLQYINNYLQRGGILVLVSHSVFQIQSTCQRGLVMEQGQAVYLGDAVTALDFYLKRKALSTDPSLSAPDSAPVHHPAPPPPTEREPVRIDQIQIKPLDGPVLQTNKPARLEVTYTALARFERIIWSFVIYNQNQTVCITGALRPESISLVEGSGTLSCIIPRLPLSNGVYMLKIGFSDLETKTPLAQSGWFDGAHRFQVENEANPIYNMATMLNALVTLEVNWEETAAPNVRVNSDNSHHEGP